MLPSWRSLVWLDEEQLAAQDIAAVNLACADGLPGAPPIAQAKECLERLDYYARCAAEYTERSKSDFHTRPGHYDHSEGKFRMVCMVRLLQKQFGVLYNEAKISEAVPLTVEDSFIHGALLGDGGTCGTLPVVYAAVGRRLGYPLKLVATATETAEHLFVRWEDPKGERFNFEANNTTMDSPPDYKYRSGRYSHVTSKVARLGGYLVSKTPRLELSAFLGQRGHCWLETGNMRQATDSFAWAWALAPKNVLMKNRLITTMNAWGKQLQALEPVWFPEMYMQTWPPRRYAETLPQDFEQDILKLEAWENILKNPEWNAAYWEPMRRRQPVRRPIAIVVAGRSGGVDIGLRFSGML